MGQPILTHLGGTFDDFGIGIPVDASGNACVTGSTGSPDFPTTPGTFETTYANNTATVRKTVQ